MALEKEQANKFEFMDDIIAKVRLQAKARMNKEVAEAKIRDKENEVILAEKRAAKRELEERRALKRAARKVKGERR